MVEQETVNGKNLDLPVRELDPLAKLRDDLSESSLIGAIIHDGTIWRGVRRQIEGWMFDNPVMATIFAGIENLAKSSPCPTIDLTTLSSSLGEIGKLEEVGGSLHIIELAERVPSSANWEAYARKVRVNAISRKRVSLLNQRITAIQSGDVEQAKIIEEQFRELDRLELSGRKIELFDLSPHIEAIVNARQGLRFPLVWGELVEDSKKHLGMGPVRDATQFRPEELTIIGGRSGHGKSSFGLNLAWQWIKEDSTKPIAFYALEVAENPITLQLLSMASREQYENFGTGLSYDELPELLRRQKCGTIDSDKAKLIDRARSYYQDRIRPGFICTYVPDWNTQDLLIHALTATEQYGNLGAVIVDYLQLVGLPGASRNTARYHEVALVAMKLKEISVLCKCPVILTAQVGRGASVLPGMEDFKESGGIENAGDILITLLNHSQQLAQIGEDLEELRDAKDNSSKKQFDRLAGMQRKLTEGLLTIKVVKNRNGVAGVRGEVGFDGKTRFICDKDTPGLLRPF